MDGVFSAAASGELTFHKLPSSSDRELQALLATVRRRVLRHLRRHGWLDGTHGEDDPIAHEDPVLAACYRGAPAAQDAMVGWHHAGGTDALALLSLARTR